MRAAFRRLIAVAALVAGVWLWLWMTGQHDILPSVAPDDLTSSLEQALSNAADTVLAKSYIAEHLPRAEAFLEETFETMGISAESRSLSGTIDKWIWSVLDLFLTADR